MSDSSAPASAFSAPDAAIITHQPQLDESLLASTSARSGRSLEELYEIRHTAHKLVEGRFQRVALQFPDEGLPDSVPIYWALKAEIDAAWEAAEGGTHAEDAAEAGESGKGPNPALEKPDLFILADTSYGNCCIDEVAAQHVDADVVVHYGHACLSPTARLPVIYVFPKRPIKPAQAASALASSAFELLSTWQKDMEPRKAILLAYDVGYAHAAEEVFESVKEGLSALASAAEELLSSPPLALTQLDVRKNFEERIADQKARGGTEAPIQPQAEALPSEARTSRKTCCGSAGNTCSTTVPDSATTSPEATATPSNACGCDSTGTSKAAPSTPAEGQGDVVNEAVSGCGSGRLYNLPSGCELSDTLILYLGGESLALTNLLLRAGPACPVITCDPQAHLESSSQPKEQDAAASHSITPPPTRREDGKTNRLLMRRYAAVQRARDASVVGLLVGTLGVRSYLPLLSHLRHLLTGRGLPGHGKDRDGISGVGGGRKVYTISVGKLSPAKLANFQEVDVFVLLACPENSLVDAVDPGGMRSKEFYKPIVTPYEMILALDESRSWTGQYVLELGNLIEDSTEGGNAGSDTDGADVNDGTNGTASAKDAGPTSDSDSDDEPHFSLVTGTYVSRRRYLARDELLSSSKDGAKAKKASQRDPDAGTVMLANGDGKSGELVHILDSASPLHLAGRSWKGLEARVGMDPPAKLEEGRGGVARGYDRERKAEGPPGPHLGDGLP